ncbi:MAG: hypothetical protein ABR587_01080, partial [Candidatus Binatia bacterium]
EPGHVAQIQEIARRSRVAKGPASATAWPTLGDTDRLGPGAESARAWKQAAALLGKENGKKLRTAKTRDNDVYGDDKALKADFGRLMDDLTATPESVARWLERLRAAARLPGSAEFTDEGRTALGAFLSVLRHADAELWEVFRERREVDHVEIALRAVQALSPGETLEK